MNKIILIGGGSASGKTFLINSIIKTIKSDEIVRLSLDDYYFDHSSLSLKEREKLNYDDPSSFDWELIFSDLFALKNGATIKKPVYDFVTHNRKKEFEIFKPKKIILVDGIMSLVKNEILHFADLKVFVYASGETRLKRRIERDTKERGRDKEGILKQYFDTVLPMHQKYIEPSKYNADIIINNSFNNNKSIKVLIPIIKELLNN